jgi:hypothetical protein
VGDLYRGRLRPLRAARLAAELPPGAAIYRGDDLDSKVYSLEASLLRTLINMQLEQKDRIPTVEVALKEAERLRRRRANAERMEARDRARAEAAGRMEQEPGEDGNPPGS